MSKQLPFRLLGVGPNLEERFMRSRILTPSSIVLRRNRPVYARIKTTAGRLVLLYGPSLESEGYNVVFLQAHDNGFMASQACEVVDVGLRLNLCRSVPHCKRASRFTIAYDGHAHDITAHFRMFSNAKELAVSEAPSESPNKDRNRILILQ